ncbi:hypothetical protein [Flavobacterium sp. WC2430]|jgi:nitrogen regulatory protein PII|uniref:hypothetical protein n=1 Tax=Flavobacterium sp. WC2430 TaxID=3234137 RepID=UPI00346608E0
MKLLIITAITAFDAAIKKMLKKADVKTFTYKEVTGFKDISEEAIESNWFGSEMNENESILYYAFVKKENVDLFFELVNEFNLEQKTLSNIHIAVLNIEKSN